MRAAVLAVALIACGTSKTPDAGPGLFTLNAGAAPRTIREADLAPVPLADAMGGKDPGWRVEDVLAALAPGDLTEVSFEGETAVTLPAAQLHDDVAILRLNRKGKLVLDVFHGAQRVDHVRDIATITAR